MSGPPSRWSFLERAMARTVNHPDALTARAWRCFVLWVAALAVPVALWAVWRQGH